MRQILLTALLIAGGFGPAGSSSTSPGGASGNLQTNDGAGGFGAYAGASCAYAVKTLDASGAASCTAAPTIPADISGAHYVTTQAESGLSAESVVPTCTGTDKLTFNGTSLSCATDQTSAGTDLSGEPFITKTASANLSNEFALGSLGAGLLKNPGATGVPTIAVSGTDYAPATSGSVLLLGNGAGGTSNYGGASSCSNQFFTGLSTVGASTCTTATLASAQFANQGTTTTVLKGNAAGNPSFAAVTLTTDVTGVLPAANGGTGTSQGNGGCVTLGSATAAAVTVGPVTWTGTFNNIIYQYEITGYSGGTPVGRLLVGVASISTTALTNGTSAYEGVAGTLTNSLSIPGAPLAVTLSAIGRSGTVHMTGRSGALKRYWIEGQNGNASVSAASTVYRAVGNFSDLSTNLPIQRAQLTVYDTLATTAASSNAFLTGTTLTVIGCP